MIDGVAVAGVCGGFEKPHDLSDRAAMQLVANLLRCHAAGMSDVEQSIASALARSDRAGRAHTEHSGLAELGASDDIAIP